MPRGAGQQPMKPGSKRKASRRRLEAKARIKCGRCDIRFRNVQFDARNPARGRHLDNGAQQSHADAMTPRRRVNLEMIDIKPACSARRFRKAKHAPSREITPKTVNLEKIDDIGRKGPVTADFHRGKAGIIRPQPRHDQAIVAQVWCEQRGATLGRAQHEAKKNPRLARSQPRDLACRITIRWADPQVLGSFAHDFVCRPRMVSRRLVAGSLLPGRFGGVKATRLAKRGLLDKWRRYWR